MKVKVFNASEEDALNDFITAHNLTEKNLNLSNERIFVVYDVEKSDTDKQIEYLEGQLHKVITDRLTDEINLRNFRSIEIKGRGSQNTRQQNSENVAAAERNTELQTDTIRHLRETIAAIKSGELVI